MASSGPRGRPGLAPVETSGPRGRSGLAPAGSSGIALFRPALTGADGLKCNNTYQYVL